MQSQPSDKLRTSVAAACVAAACLTCLVAGSATAEQGTEYESLRTVLKATKHIDVGEVQGVLELLDVKFAVKPDQNVIVLRGANGAVENAMRVIDTLDNPRPSIDLRIAVLAASQTDDADIPSELEATVDQLRGVFGYSGFVLLDTVLLSVLEGRQGRVDGGLQLGESTARAAYRFSFQKVTVVPEEGRRRNIRIKGLKFDVSGELAGSLRASLMTDVQIREGQKAVVGSSTPQGVGETLVLVVQAKASPDASWASE